MGGSDFRRFGAVTPETPVLEQVRGSLLALRAGEAPGLGAGAVGEAGV
jgi:hypothetical protein